MSIFGCRGTNGVTDSQNAATKNYVDTQDNLRVLKAGDTMSGDLRMSIGSDTVRLLGCVDLSEGKGFSLPLGNFQNQLQFAVIPPPQTQTPVTMHTTHGFLVMKNNEPVCQLGDPGPDNQVIVHRRIAMNNNLIKFLRDPVDPQDAATKGFVDTQTERVVVIARVGRTNNEHAEITLGGHTALGKLFRYAYGNSAASWANGVFTAPADGVYTVSIELRVRSPRDTGSLGNVYTSKNGSTSYGTDVDIIYRVYSRTGALSTWHSLELCGIVTLTKGDTLGLNSSWGSSTWEFHTSASIHIGRISI